MLVERTSLRGYLVQFMLNERIPASSSDGSHVLLEIIIEGSWVVLVDDLGKQLLCLDREPLEGETPQIPIRCSA